MSQALFDLASAGFVTAAVIVVVGLSRRLAAVERHLAALTRSQSDHYLHHVESLDRR